MSAGTCLELASKLGGYSRELLALASLHNPSAGRATIRTVNTLLEVSKGLNECINICHDALPPKKPAGQPQPEASVTTKAA